MPPLASTPQVLVDHQDGRRLEYLPADDELLKIASRQGAGGTFGTRRAHVEFRDDSLREFPRPAPVCETEAGEPHSLRSGHECVLNEIHVGRRRVADALLRRNQQSHSAPDRKRCAPDRLSTDQDFAGVGKRFARQYRNKLLLAVPAIPAIPGSPVSRKETRAVRFRRPDPMHGRGFGRP